MAAVDPSRLEDAALFQGLTSDERDAILTEAKMSRYSKSEHIFNEGEDAHSFFLLLTGHVRAIKATSSGQQVVIRYVAPGEVFGIAEALGLQQYPATTEAVVDSVVLLWPSAIWSRLVKKYPLLARNALQTVGGRLRDAHERVIEISTEQAERRVAHALLRLAKQTGRKLQAGIEIDFPISRQDVAEMTGTTLHTVSRILSAWEQAGLIESGRRRILLRDLERLNRIADEPRS
jgi:CRP-like cAMP-binding protein